MKALEQIELMPKSQNPKHFNRFGSLVLAEIFQPQKKKKQNLYPEQKILFLEL